MVVTEIFSRGAKKIISIKIIPEKKTAGLVGRVLA
jgi:hypothetical protein